MSRLGLNLFQLVMNMAQQVASNVTALPPPPSVATLISPPRWEWAPDYSSAIDRNIWPDLIWKNEDYGGGSEGAPGSPAGWYTPRACDTGSEGYSCGGGEKAPILTDWGTPLPGYANDYSTLKAAGLWNLLDQYGHTWDFLNRVATGATDFAYGRLADTRNDTSAFARGIMHAGIPFGLSNDWISVYQGVQQMLAGLNPNFVNALAKGIADYYVSYWASIQDSDDFTFRNFFGAALQGFGEILSVPPIRAALAAISLGASIGATEAAIEAGAEIGGELAVESLAPEMIDFALEDFGTDVLAETLPEAIAPEIASDVATTGAASMDDLFFDFGDDLVFEADALPDFMPMDSFVDNFDMLPDDTIMYQEPEVLDLPLPDVAVPPQFSYSDLFKLGKTGVDIYKNITHDTASLQSATGGYGLPINPKPGGVQVQRVAPGITQPVAGNLPVSDFSGIVKLLAGAATVYTILK